MNLLITGAWPQAEGHIEELEKMNHEVRFMQWEKDEIPVEKKWIEGIICNSLFLYHPISSFPNLRFIQLTSAGYDRVDLSFISDHKITIHNAKGVYSIPMAEYVVAGVLSLYKRLFEFQTQQKNREWKKIRGIRELSGKRVVIIGCGDVGIQCAKRFKAFGCEIVGLNRTVRIIDCFDRVVELERIDTEIEIADIVVVTIGLTAATRGIVKAKKMRKDAVLVNISRGPTVDLDSAECQMILDVFDTEPLKTESELWCRDLITPHNSFVGEGNADRLSRVIMENLKNL